MFIKHSDISNSHSINFNTIYTSLSINQLLFFYQDADHSGHYLPCCCRCRHPCLSLGPTTTTTSSSTTARANFCRSAGILWLPLTLLCSSNFRFRLTAVVMQTRFAALRMKLMEPPARVLLIRLSTAMARLSAATTMATV